MSGKSIKIDNILLIELNCPSDEKQREGEGISDYFSNTWNLLDLIIANSIMPSR